MRDSRIDKLANVLVTYSVNVKRDDLVRVSGPVVAMPLIRAVYREVLEAGGHPLLRITDDECADIYFEQASKRQMSYVNPLSLREIETINGHIGIWADENTKAMTRVAPKKQALVSQARQPMMDKFFKRASKTGKDKLRWTGTQFPCNAAAQDAERSLTQYEEFVFNAGLLHLPDPAAAWKKLSVAQKRMCDFLNKANEVHITAPNGTDITFGVKGRRWINCDGHENFPDGEVFTGPIENATEGVVCYSFPAVHGGREVHDIRLRFKAGKVVDASASKGEDFLFNMMDQDAGGRVLGELAFGTNYSITEYTRNTLFDEKIGGTFHAALGAAYPESGGKNKSALHWDMVCDQHQGGIIKVDGKVISKNGRFTQKTWPQPGRK